MRGSNGECRIVNLDGNRMTTSPILFIHICAGTIGLLSGAAALFFRKGSVRHITAGKVFVISMLGNALSATLLAYLIQDWDNILGGPTTIYFIATAWMTVRRKEGETGRFEIVAFLVAVAGVAVNLVGAWLVANSEEYTLPAGIPYIFAALWAVAAALGPWFGGYSSAADQDQCKPDEHRSLLSQDSSD